MWIVLFTGSDLCGLFCLLALIYIEFSVYWLLFMWIVLFMYVFLYKLCSVYWLQCMWVFLFSFFGEERAGYFALFEFLVSCDCCVALPLGATGLSAVCDCGISLSYLLTSCHTKGCETLS